MDSSNGMKSNTKDFRHVYVRKRKGIASKRAASDLNEKVPIQDLNDLPLESNSPKLNTDGSHENGDGEKRFAHGLSNDAKLIHCRACPRIYHWDYLGFKLKAAPDKEWQCSNCFTDDDLYLPLKYLKNVDSKKCLSSKNRFTKGKSHSNAAITNKEV